MSIWEVLILLGILGAVGGGMFVSCKHDSRLRAACLADGHKEYECAAMLDRRGGAHIYQRGR